MQCPHCRIEVADSVVECPQCGLVVAKWRAAVQQDQSGQAQPQAAPAKQAPGWNLSIWIILLVATVGVWRLSRSGDAGRGSAAAAAKAFAGKAEGPIPAGSWRFQGRVTDLLREAPIKGARVAFTDFETGSQIEDVTDEEGRYSVDAAIRWKLGYAAAVTHPAYLSRYWTGKDLTAPRSERLRLGVEPASTEPDTRCYRGTRKNEPLALDFALFPQDLSDAERQEAGL